MSRVTAHPHTYLAVEPSLDLDHTWLTSLDNPSEVAEVNDHIRVQLGSGLSLGGQWQDIVSLAEALAAYVADEADRRDVERTSRKELAADPDLARILSRPVVMDGAA